MQLRRAALQGVDLVAQHADAAGRQRLAHLGCAAAMVMVAEHGEGRRLQRLQARQEFVRGLVGPFLDEIAGDDHQIRLQVIDARQPASQARRR